MRLQMRAESVSKVKKKLTEAWESESPELCLLSSLVNSHTELNWTEQKHFHYFVVNKHTGRQANWFLFSRCWTAGYFLFLCLCVFQISNSISNSPSPSLSTSSQSHLAFCQLIISLLLFFFFFPEPCVNLFSPSLSFSSSLSLSINLQRQFTASTTTTTTTFSFVWQPVFTCLFCRVFPVT